LPDTRVAHDTTERDRAFTAFVRAAQDPVRHALVAGFGLEIGRDAAQEAMTHAWRHWDRVSGMENPAGYVYRVGHRVAQKMVTKRNRRVAFPEVPEASNPITIEPALPGALSRLSQRQRVVVVTVCGYGLSQRETAGLLGITRSSVQRHLDRGMARLRAELGVTSDD
jgi:RNA polymerase sigma factor (sigma-70 family)